MTQPGRGGQQQPPLNSAAGQPTPVGTQPGVSQGIVRARQVIISGSADGVFVYYGTPGPGTLAGSWAAAAGTDPYGNSYVAGLSIGTAGNPQVLLRPATSPGSASEIQFAVTTPALSNTPNIGAGEIDAGAGADLVISGPAIAVAGSEDWVQIAMFSNIGGGTANLEFIYVDTNGVANLMATMNDAGWTFSGAANFTATLSVGGVDIVLALSGQPTTTNGLTDGTINGSSSTTGLPNGGIQGTSGAASAGTAHTHSPGSYSVTNGMHSHTAGSYAVANGLHAHDLPTF
jgi:hypothetical protein